MVLIGVKYTASTPPRDPPHQGGDRQGFCRFLRRRRNGDVGLSFGADGIIGSFYNRCLRSGWHQATRSPRATWPEAKRLQEIGNAVIFFSTRGGVACIKRAMAWQGCDAGYVRRPLGTVIDKAAEDKACCRVPATARRAQLTGVAFSTRSDCWPWCPQRPHAEQRSLGPCSGSTTDLVDAIRRGADLASAPPSGNNQRAISTPPPDSNERSKRLPSSARPCCSMIAGPPAS